MCIAYSYISIHTSVRIYDICVSNHGWRVKARFLVRSLKYWDKLRPPPCWSCWFIINPSGCIHILIKPWVVALLHPWKLTWQWKISPCLIGDTSSNGGFLIAMWVFKQSGNHIPIFLCWTIISVHLMPSDSHCLPSKKGTGTMECWMAHLKGFFPNVKQNFTRCWLNHPHWRKICSSQIASWIPGFFGDNSKKICVQPPTCFFLSQLWSGHFRFSLIQGQVLSSKILGRIFVPKNPTKPGVCKKQCCSRYSVSKKTMPTFKFCWNFLLENIQFQTSRFRAMKKKQPELRKPQTAATTTASREKIAEKMERQIYDRLPEKPSDPNQQFFLVDFWVRGRHSWLRKATKMRLRRGL